ncbi:hypothetical protein [Thermocrinis minervae]|uniref:Ferredoxin--NADP+ reductase n=1 Tax=Thermocrinis minervae TaxID=381751 RepID=A0A1M6RFK2_9AQUI|nr:hypothetical protein [Thermocrinis minervae]SHK31232.1 ferredoxin--NADP+ reductase [Thermocrinis minervae]
MYPITFKRDVSEDYFLLGIEAKHLTNFQPGQYAILQTTELSERIPLSILRVENDRVEFLVQKRGKSTLELYHSTEIFYVAGPLGKPFPLGVYGKVYMYGIDWGPASLYSVAKALKSLDNKVYLFVSGKYPPLEIVEDAFDKVSLSFEMPKDADLVVVAGKASELKDFVESLKGYPCIALSTAPILCGVGLCLSCRVYSEGKERLSCTDGPWFEASSLDWQSLTLRENLYVEEESLALEEYLKELRRRALREATS